MEGAHEEGGTNFEKEVLIQKIKTTINADLDRYRGQKSGEKRKKVNLRNEKDQDASGDDKKRDLCDKYTCCDIEQSSCDISSMEKDTSTLVFPGGDTRCIYSDSTPYAFQVIPGATDKLLFYFQGGGACWDLISDSLNFCSSDISPQGSSGLFDRSNSQNLYSDYTVVFAMYCSGDVWGGNTTRPYSDKQGVPVRQVGYYNARATLDWVQQQQSKNLLASTLSSLVIMGCSAGSVGAQLWGKTLLNSLSWKVASVIPDSYAGVFPDGSQGPLIYDFGLCTWAPTFLSQELVDACLNQSLDFQMMMNYQIPLTPNVPYAYIQSKADIVQQSFYIAIGLTTMNTSAFIDPSLFYQGVNEIFSEYNAHPNFLTYLVDGGQHCFTNMDVFYQADAKGPHDDGATNEQEMMFEWTYSYPLGDGETSSTVCEGDYVDVAMSLESQTAEQDATDPQYKNTYCNSSVAPKAFVAPY